MEKVELDKLTKIVDDFVTQLKKDLLAVEYKPTTTGVLPGVWDRMKNWWYNSVLKKGGNDTNNPYVYKNKFGALGGNEDDTKKESIRLTLSQYNFIKEQYNKLESDLSVLNEDLETESENLKKLKLFRIIDGWAGKFKQEIIKQFSGSTSLADPVEKEKLDDEEKRTNTQQPISSIPTASAKMPNTDQSKTEERRSRGAPKGLRIYWKKDEGWNWGPKYENPPESISDKLNMGLTETKVGKFPTYLINKIKKHVHKKLKEDYEHPDFEETLEKYFITALNRTLDINKENPGDHSDWMDWLSTSVAKEFDLHLDMVASREKSKEGVTDKNKLKWYDDNMKSPLEEYK